LFAALLLYLIVFPLLTSLPIEANPTKKWLKSGKRRKNIKSYCPHSIDEIRVVDEDLAHLLGENRFAAALEVK
jgi:hypothetical protein